MPANKLLDAFKASQFHNNTSGTHYCTDTLANLKTLRPGFAVHTCSVWRHTHCYSTPCPSLCSPRRGWCSRRACKCYGWRWESHSGRGQRSPQLPSERQNKTKDKYRCLHLKVFIQPSTSQLHGINATVCSRCC